MTLDDPRDIAALVALLDTTSVAQAEAAWEALRPLQVAVVPHLAQAYPGFKKWQGRAALVFHAIRHARVSDDAYGLGVRALSDRATLVRYRACMLLAYAQRREALPALEALRNHSDPRTAADARAAIDAITSQNHHYFIDRQHTGRMFWELDGAPAAS